jgi:hypothetical protein
LQLAALKTFYIMGPNKKSFQFWVSFLVVQFSGVHLQLQHWNSSTKWVQIISLQSWAPFLVVQFSGVHLQLQHWNSSTKWVLIKSLKMWSIPCAILWCTFGTAELRNFHTMGTEWNPLQSQEFLVLFQCTFATADWKLSTTQWWVLLKLQSWDFSKERSQF